MAESRKEERTGEKEQKRQPSLVAPTPPEREMPRILSAETEKVRAQEDTDAPTEYTRRAEPGSDADAELEIMLKQIEGYFLKRARHHDLEAISFTLRHLFSRVDFLYRQALPELDAWTAREERERETFVHQQIWLHLQTVNRTLDRMAPLCHLLSDVIECLLETLDNEELWLRTFEEEDTLQLQQVHLPDKQKRSASDDQPEESDERTTRASEVWERAATTLMDRLLLWQEQHHKLTPFQQQFAQPTLASINLSELDTAFAVLLDSAGAIFGDILPNFRLVEPESHEEISALLFDLMQQSDQMLVQFEVTLGPLTALLRHFAALSEGG
jgi:hypothetical protein